MIGAGGLRSSPTEVDAMLKFLRALFLLPARLLGGGPRGAVHH
jgi:hypothetical protein